MVLPGSRSKYSAATRPEAGNLISGSECTAPIQGEKDEEVSGLAKGLGAEART